MSKVILSATYKEAFANLSLNKDFQKVVDWMKLQKNNLAVIEWARTSSSDPFLAVKKARYEGNIEMVNLFLEALEIAKKNKEDDK